MPCPAGACGEEPEPGRDDQRGGSPSAGPAAGAWLRRVLAVLLLLALATGGWAAQRPRRTGPDSFLKWQVTSVEQLVDQVKQDAVVRQRLAKHFHVSQADLIVYLRTNLRASRLPKAARVTVYGVTRTGRIYRTVSRLPRGTAVFSLADGTPVLRMTCGNPLRRVLPPVPPPPVSTPQPAPVPTVQVPREALPAEEAPPVDVPEEFVLAAEVPIAPSFEVFPTTVDRRPPYWLLLLPLLGGDHDRPRPPPPPPVPEPSTAVFVGIGVAVLGWRLRARSGGGRRSAGR